MWKDLRASHDLAWRLFRRDISAQYRQSFLGIFWAFLPPIVTSLVFITLRSQGVISFGETDIPYPVYVLVGTILWQLFVQSLNAPLKSVTAAKPILAKISFPYEALIVSAIYGALFSLSINLVILAGVFLVFQVELTLALVFAPLAVFMLILLGITIGLFLTPFGMLYSDIPTGLPIIVQLWFFVTAVIYPPPQTFPLSLIFMLNPVNPLLIGARDLITIGHMENYLSFLVVCGLTIIGLFVAWLIYRVSIPILIERISS